LISQDESVILLVLDGDRERLFGRRENELEWCSICNRTSRLNAIGRR
jgi:hypothetical protein